MGEVASLPEWPRTAPRVSSPDVPAGPSQAVTEQDRGACPGGSEGQPEARQVQPFNSPLTEFLLHAGIPWTLGAAVHRPAIPYNSRFAWGQTCLSFQRGPGKVGRQKDAQPSSLAFAGKPSPYEGPSPSLRQKMVS